MSWTVPQGCYYGCLYGTSWDVNQVHYYGAGSSVPDSEALESNSFGMLIDFINNYIYTRWLGSTITINSNNTFTLSNNRISSTTSVRIIGSEKGLESMNLTIVGNFSFGDGTGLLSKSALKLSNTEYSAYLAFRGRDDITIARFADGLNEAVSMYNGCPLESVEQIPNTVTNLVSTFANTPLIEAPAIPSSVVSMNSCFANCSSLTSPPDLSNATALIRMYCCFKGCTSLATAPSIPSTVTDMEQCFYDCQSLTMPPVIPNGVEKLNLTFYKCYMLTSAPSIPSSVTNIQGCFASCSSLVGNVVVYASSVTSYTNAFAGTNNDIYIINGAGTSAVETLWKTIASGYSNVHYEVDDNPIPALTYSITRVGGMNSTTPTENGEYAYINATAIVYDTYIPDGWTMVYDEGGEALTLDGTSQSPSWTRDDDDNVWTLECWRSLGDTTKHIFTLQVQDKIRDANSTLKATQLSTIVTQILPKAYKLVDYYHDPNDDTEGMAIGKFATDANLFDVDMPALFRDTLSLKDGNAVIRLLFDYVYPVGSYYETSKSQAEFDPNVVWGGTWELETEGQVHVSSGTNYPVVGALTNSNDAGNKDAIVPYHNHSVNQFSTGGEASHTHSLSSHTHGTGVSGKTYFIVAAGMSNDNFSTLQSGSGRSYPQYAADNAFAAHSATAGPSNNTSGAGSSHSHTVGAHNTNYTPSTDNRTNANMQPYIVVNRWHRTA